MAWNHLRMVQSQLEPSNLRSLRVFLSCGKLSFSLLSTSLITDARAATVLELDPWDKADSTGRSDVVGGQDGKF